MVGRAGCRRRVYDPKKPEGVRGPRHSPQLYSVLLDICSHFGLHTIPNVSQTDILEGKRATFVLLYFIQTRYRQREEFSRQLRGDYDEVRGQMRGRQEAGTLVSMLPQASRSARTLGILAGRNDSVRGQNYAPFVTQVLQKHTRYLERRHVEGETNSSPFPTEQEALAPIDASARQNPTEIRAGPARPATGEAVETEPPVADTDLSPFEVLYAEGEYRFANREIPLARAEDYRRGNGRYPWTMRQAVRLVETGMRGQTSQFDLNLAKATVRTRSGKIFFFF